MKHRKVSYDCIIVFWKEKKTFNTDRINAIIFTHHSLDREICCLKVPGEIVMLHSEDSVSIGIMRCGKSYWSCIQRVLQNIYSVKTSPKDLDLYRIYNTSKMQWLENHNDIYFFFLYTSVKNVKVYAVSKLWNVFDDNIYFYFL